MTSPRTLLKAWNFRAKKQLGQNFLSDPSTAKMIVQRSKINPDDVILEIGAGFGALTIASATMAQKVYAVETDHRLIKLLETELQAHKLSNVEIIEKDILKLDLKAIARRGGRRLVILGNLPYHISSQILVMLVKSRCSVERAVLMFQKELAQRLIAGPGSKDWGRISVMVQYCAGIRRLASVQAALFYPKPKVDSEVLGFDFHHPPKYPATDETILARVIKAAFSKRRKTLKNALSTSELHIRPEIAAKMLEQAGIDPVRRAETLTVEEFVRLGNIYHEVITR